MTQKLELINSQLDDNYEVRLALDGLTVEDAREFLKKLGDALDEDS